jgi:hypothetical protein
LIVPGIGCSGLYGRGEEELPLFREVEERAGERRRLMVTKPLSPALSPLVPRGARGIGNGRSNGHGVSRGADA